ncbi:MAG TPA: outer membrane protein transport protein [Luteibacter sp.]|jgi:long-chain fatty acid transport protein|nr:outer membrane protein transport protein [Luteibacter sp.]
MQKSFLNRSRPLVLAALTVAIAGALVAPRAEASAFQLKENSAKALGRAFAGSAAAGDDASVIVNNPAAMSLLPGTYTFQADVTGINFSSQFHGTGTDAQGRPLTGGDGGDAGTTIPVPALYFAAKVGDRWHIGAAFTAPFGFKTDYDSGWVGRYNAIKSDFKSLDGTLSASFDVTDTFSIGASFIAQKTSAELTSAINFNSVGLGLIQQAAAGGLLPPQLVPQYLALVNGAIPPGTDGLVRIKGDDWAYGWQLGGLWRVTDKDRIALNYRSKIDSTLEGTANYVVPSNVTAVLGSPQVAPILAGAGGVPFTHTTGTADFTTPAVATASFWHQDEKFGLGADISWTKWDSFKELAVNYGNPAQPPSSETYNWRNSWFVSVGGEYYMSDKLTLRGGVAVDSTPTYSATRSPRVPDSTRKWVALGIGYNATKNFEINAGYAHIFVNKAHMDGVASPTGDVLVGENDDKGNLLSLSAKYSF